MKASYVSGSNSFLAYSQDGLLNGVDYAANLFLFERYLLSYVEFVNDYGDLLLTKIMVTTGDLTGSNMFTLTLGSSINGQWVNTPIWMRTFPDPDGILAGVRFYENDFNHPVLRGNKLIFFNDAGISLDVKRVTFVFRPLLVKVLG